MSKIGFLGAGQMATALAVGFLKSGIVSKKELFASDAIPAFAEQFANITGATISPSNRYLVKKVDLLFLSVKPQQMGDVLKEINGKGNPNTLYISIAAGLPIAFFENRLEKNAKIVRVMPNTPCLVGCGVSAFVVSPNVNSEERDLIKKLLATGGIVEELAESQFDAVAGLSGSGPAFVSIIIEAMSDAGVKMGLPRTLATRFAAQTVLGTAELVLKTNDHPAVIKDRVASPSGTTIAGIYALEKHAVRAGIIAAVEAATNRSKELSQQ